MCANISVGKEEMVVVLLTAMAMVMLEGCILGWGGWKMEWYAIFT